MISNSAFSNRHYDHIFAPPLTLVKIRGPVAVPRANRHYIPGHAWHITHRCHKKEFLLKFAKDRQSWIDWLFEAKKRYGMVVLNYMATSKHIHLLVYEKQGGDFIPKSVQLGGRAHGSGIQ